MSIMDDDPDMDSMDLMVVSRLLESGSRNTVQPMFCQMNRLTESYKDVVWIQVARWITFQEVLDEDANRWSKPHVPSLSLKALTCLRKELRHAFLLLDPEVTDYSCVVDRLTTHWIQSGYLDRSLEVEIKMTLHKPVRHVNENKLSRPSSVGSNLLAIKERNLGGSGASLQSVDSLASDKDGSPNSSANDLSETGSSKGTPSMKRKATRFERKIPKNSVATTILVGEIPSLRRPLVALVRLNPARHLAWLCQVPLTTQFIFVCLAPKALSEYDVIEMGRCVGSLMTDPIFREVAARCSNRFEILAGVREFSSHLTALPSCVWDPVTRLEPPVKLPSQEFRRITQKALEEEKAHLEETKLKDTKTVELTRTGRLFGGLVADIKRKAPWYVSDFKDCLHIQCLASTIFLFLATLTPNVTFGGLLGQMTDQYMGTMECILAASITGVVYALLSGQPLNILGSTGPMLVLEMIIFQYCRDNGWDFMPFRVWIGLWTTFTLVVIVAFDLSALVRFITRFTEECFACLIAIIFIYEAFAKVIEINDNYPVYFGSHHNIPSCSASHKSSETDFLPENGNAPQIFNSTNNFNGSSLGTSTDFPGLITSVGSVVTSLATNTTMPPSLCPRYVGDVFFLSLVEFLFTFVIAFTLVKFRNSIFFPNVVRQTLSDFGVLIAILVVVGVDIALNINTPKLIVPATFSPTRAGRSWFINPVSDKNPWWLALAAALPAFLATILIFMDQQITAVIVNRKEHKLKKGGGYHLDIFVLAILISINSLLGLPWYVAATVSAIAHIFSLKVESDCTAPGEKPEFLGVREQRVTALLVGLLSGLSVLITGVLKFIPLPVLYGVFLFMGIQSLNGMQLVDRCLLYIISPKYQPDYPYLRHVALNRVHIYTFVQILCLAGLWIMKSLKATSVGFPIMVLAICFVRKLLDCVFTQQELSWVDHVLPPVCTKKEEHELYCVSPSGDLQNSVAHVIGIEMIASRTTNSINKTNITSSVTSADQTDSTRIKPTIM